MKYTYLSIAALLSMSASVYAQEDSRFGISGKVNGLRPFFGVVYHTSDRIALRLLGTAEGSLQGSGTVFLEANLLVHRWVDEELAFYVGPDILYGRSGGNGTVWVGFLLGSQYRPHRKFSVFGEILVNVDTAGSNYVSFFNSGVGVTYFLR